MSKAESDSRADLEKANSDTSMAITAVAAVGATSSILGGLGWGISGFIGVFLGAAIAVGNLYIFKKLGQAFLTNSGSNRALWALIGVLKFVVLMALVVYLLRHRIVGAIPLIVGYASLPVGITLSSLLGARYEGASR